MSESGVNIERVTYTGLVFQLSGKKEEKGVADLWDQCKRVMVGTMPPEHTVVMPCGNSRTFTPEDVLALPIVDIPCPCGDDNHFIARFVDMRAN